MNVFLRVFSKTFASAIILFSVGSVVFSQRADISSAIADLLSGDRTVRYAAIYDIAVAKDDPRSIEPLISTLNDPDLEIRSMAVRVLGFRKDRRAVPALITLLKDNQVWGIAAESLGEIGDDAAVEPLIEALNKEILNATETTCNYSVVQALGKLHDARAVKPLFTYLLGHNCGSGVWEAMGPVAVEPMIKIIANGSPDERASAAWILGYIADERALEALISRLSDNGGNYNASNAIALRIGKSAVEALRDAFKSGDQLTKKMSLGTLGKIDDERAGDVLIELITDSVNPDWMRRNLVESLIELHRNSYGPKNPYVVTAVLASIKDKNADIRNLAIRGLANEERDDVYQAIFDAMSDPATSAEASLVVGRHKDLRSLPRLFEALRGEDPMMAGRASQVLTVIGKPAVDGLISVLTDKNKEFPLRELTRRKELANSSFMFRCGNDPPDPILDPRVLAANALGEIGDERARKPLTEALKDKAEWLRDVAAAALVKLRKRELPLDMP